MPAPSPSGPVSGAGAGATHAPVRLPVPGLFDTAAVGYAQVLTAGHLVFIAGQAGLDEHFEVVSAGFADQTRQALRNLGHALHAAGCDYDSVVAVTVYLTDITHLGSYAEIRREIMGEAAPTSTAVEVSALALPGLHIEITAIALRSTP